MQTYTEQQAQRIREEWFPAHVAKFSEAREDNMITGWGIQMLTWRKPTDSNYYCRYVIDGSALMVYGDIGEAVYHFGNTPITWEWLATCELSYFASKCAASETGRLFKGWDSRCALQSIQQHMRDNPTDKKAYNKIVPNDPPPLTWRNEWEHWLARNIEDLGYELCGALIGCGEVVHIRCHGHLLGIQMAVEKEKAAKVEA